MINVTGLFRVVLISTTISLGGCSTVGQVFFDRPVIQDKFKNDQTYALSLTADRRIAVFTTRGSDKKRLSCAEALPDVAVSSDVESSIKLALKELDKDASLDTAEKVKQAITVAYQRTEKSDLVRQLGWQLCQAYLNDAIDDKGYFYLLERLVVASLVDTKDKDDDDTNALHKLLKAEVPEDK